MTLIDPNLPRESGLATREDVIQCYKTILKREPESEAVIQHCLSKNQSIWGLVESFANSTELKLSLIKSELYIFNNDKYLSRNLPDVDKFRCHHYHNLYIYNNIPYSSFNQIINNYIYLFKKSISSNIYSISVNKPHENRNEGELSLIFWVNENPIYTLSFSVIPGYVAGLRDRQVILISRMQGFAGRFSDIKQATKDMSDISPQAMVFSALQGVAMAGKIRKIIGVSAENHIHFQLEKAEIYHKAYNNFYESINAENLGNGFYAFRTISRPKPMKSVKRGHKIRTRLKRLIKSEIIYASYVMWSHMSWRGLRRLSGARHAMHEAKGA